LNAAGQVPLLEVEIDGETRWLGQSLAILAYLEEAFPEPALLPVGAFERARARQLAELVNAGIQPIQNLTVIQKLRGMDVDAKAWCQEFIASGLAAYEATMAQTAGRFSVGDNPTWADACLVPQLYNARRFDLDLTAYPTILEVESNCFELPAFSDTTPEKMPDAF
jgi:maleylpyruvate isomerase